MVFRMIYSRDVKWFDLGGKSEPIGPIPLRQYRLVLFPSQKNNKREDSYEENKKRDGDLTAQHDDFFSFFIYIAKDIRISFFFLLTKERPLSTETSFSPLLEHYSSGTTGLVN